MTGARFVVTLLGFAAVGLVAASLAWYSPGWWEATTTTTSGTSTIYIGPLETCTGSSCALNSYQDLTFSACTRSANDQKSRFWAVFALALLAGFLALVAACTASIAAKAPVLAAAGMSFFGAVSGGISMGLFYQTMEKWLYCNDTYCSVISATSCKTSIMTWPFILMGCATVILIIAALVGAAVGASMSRPDTASETAPTAVQGGDNVAPPTAAVAEEANGTGDAAKSNDTSEKAVDDAIIRNHNTNIAIDASILAESVERQRTAVAWAHDHTVEQSALERIVGVLRAAVEYSDEAVRRAGCEVLYAASTSTNQELRNLADALLSAFTDTTRQFYDQVTGASEAPVEEVAAEDDQGDWYWDESANMYWSDSSQLYLDWDSGWYYDPYSGYWYDPESGEWILAEESAEAA